MDFNFKLGIMNLYLLVNFHKDIEYSPWDNTVEALDFLWNGLVLHGCSLFNHVNHLVRAQHRVSLTRTTLPISEYCPIVAFNVLLNGALSANLVHSVLSTKLVQHLIKSEHCRYLIPVRVPID